MVMALLCIMMYKLRADRACDHGFWEGRKPTSHYLLDPRARHSITAVRQQTRRYTGGGGGVCVCTVVVVVVIIVVCVCV